LRLTAPALRADGSVDVTLAVTGGTPAVAAYVIDITLADGSGKPFEEWDGHALSRLPHQSLGNRYSYQRIAPGIYGLKAPVGATAVLHLPAQQTVPPGNYRLVAIDIDGRRFGIPVTLTAP
ncbi:MAG TPA: TQO small subunit DoxA domain-containing protein, partial [Acidiferrobacteraceae bacterium]|nr:TQO small subunit DoxA domain-containing protein [Acidiferrobacteraceae bacterium]